MSMGGQERVVLRCRNPRYFSSTAPASADLEYLGFSFFIAVANPTIFPVKIGAGTVVIARVAAMISSPPQQERPIQDRS